MNVKMIVTDLDNTLLRRDKIVSGYTASVFSRCRDAGIKIVFATARPVRAVAKWLDMGIQSDACIYHNGAVIHIDGEMFQETGIEHYFASKLLKAAQQLDSMRIAVEINDMLYANFDAGAIWPDVEYAMTDFGNLPKLPADKIIFITADKTEIGKIERLLGDDLYWEISENEVLMVMNKNARKRNAVNALAAQFGIPLSEIAAFGDDHNDVEMLRECGVGVAVANAIDEAKASADYLCDTNDNDGVAKWLEDNVL
jgi:Cof subfamily protein (haloacid dehalogenase superfamily)